MLVQPKITQMFVRARDLKVGDYVCGMAYVAISVKRTFKGQEFDPSKSEIAGHVRVEFPPGFGHTKRATAHFHPDSLIHIFR